MNNQDASLWASAGDNLGRCGGGQYVSAFCFIVSLDWSHRLSIGHLIYALVAINVSMHAQTVTRSDAGDACFAKTREESG